MSARKRFDEPSPGSRLSLGAMYGSLSISASSADAAIGAPASASATTRMTAATTKTSY
jgi:hypothetical protein